MTKKLAQQCLELLQDEAVRARSSRGHIYAARNLIQNMPEVKTFWQSGPLMQFLQKVLGADFGLVRVLYFDKPPDRTWSLPWHKDKSIAVLDNTMPTQHFSLPTRKAGIPHFVAADEILRSMVTLRIHLDDVTNANGPLEVIPGSHQSSSCEGSGIDSAVTILANAGDVLAMRPLISHASGSSRPGVQKHRRILHLEFSSLKELPDSVEWHDFVPARLSD